MKKILVTGKGSYIGASFKKYMKQFPNDYQVDELDMLDNSAIEVYFLHNNAYMCTCEILKDKIKRDRTRGIYTFLSNSIIKFLVEKIRNVKRELGDLLYEK